MNIFRGVCCGLIWALTFPARLVVTLIYTTILLFFFPIALIISVRDWACKGRYFTFNFKKIVWLWIDYLLLDDWETIERILYE